MSAFTPELAAKLDGFLSTASLITTVFIIYVVYKALKKALKYLYGKAVSKLKPEQAEKVAGYDT